jgi:hypothetical protein
VFLQNDDIYNISGPLVNNERDVRHPHTELPIVPVHLTDVDKKTRLTVNALLDAGATHTLLSRRSAEALGLKGPEKEVFCRLALGEKVRCKQMTARCRVLLADGQPYTTTVKVVDSPCGGLFPAAWDKLAHNYTHLRSLQLPKINIKDEVTMIIGQSDQFLMRHLCVDIVGEPNEPVAALTPLGWVVQGVTDASSVPDSDRIQHIYRVIVDIQEELTIEDSMTKNQAHACDARDAQHLGLRNRQPVSHTCVHCSVGDETRPQEGEPWADVCAILAQGAGVPAETYYLAKSVLDQLSEKIAREREPDLTREEEDHGLSAEEARCLDLLRSEREFHDGRYTMPVLWRVGEPNIPTNYAHARRRLEKNEQALAKHAGARQRYDEILQDYLSKEYITEVENAKAGAHYIPHFPVIKEGRVRIVFDAAARTCGKALNDCISPGPSLVQDLNDVLLQFRRYPVVVASDVSELFLQIQMKPQDQLFHRFLHRMATEDHVREFQWQRHPFGNSGSPAVAMATVRFHADDYAGDFPLAAEAVRRATLVDDTLASYRTEEQAIDAYHQMTELFGLASMKLHKVISNKPRVLETVPRDMRKEQADYLTIANLGGKPETSRCKMLGIQYYPTKDVLQFRLQVCDELMASRHPWTKRKMLVVLSHLYDPAGLASPMSLVPRLLFHEVVRQGYDWDEKLPPNAAFDEWVRSAQEDLPSIEIQRCFGSTEEGTTPDDDVSLHVFTDASSQALGVAVYLRVRRGDTTSVNLVAGKCRLAQLRAASIPRLELAAAEIGVRIANRISTALNITNVQFYTDSCCVLWWLTIKDKRLQLYIMNRINKILLYTNRDQWKFVPTHLNPADLATRGMLADKLRGAQLWFHGPSFILTGELPPQPLIAPTADALKEIKSPFREMLDSHSLSVHFVADSEKATSDTGAAPSSDPEMRTLQKGEAVALSPDELTKAKWVDIVRERAQLNGEEYDITEARVFLTEQKNAWPEAFRQIAQCGRVRSSHRLACLNPQPDEEGLLRVSARLRFIPHLPFNARCPVLLPAEGQVAYLITKDMHERRLDHAGGADRLHTAVQQEFWLVPGGRRLARKVTNGCTRCRYRNARPALAPEAPLPSFRVPSGHRAFCFEQCIVDAAGPFPITRGRGTEKRWVIIFVCLSYRAVHFEVIHEMSTSSFLACLQRFVARRGMPKTIRSDNGGNFRGAAAVLPDLLSNDDGTIAGKFPEIRWVFQTPLSPHTSGIVERSVGLLKKVLLHTMTAAQASAPSLRDEEFVTLVTVAEGLLNSRPLAYSTDDPDNLRPITPAHFLAAPPLDALLFDPDFAARGGPTLGRRHRKLQQLLGECWRRFIQELTATKNRLNKKWLQNRGTLDEGDIVVILEGSSRGKFPLGRIVRVYRNAADGQARVADVLVNGKVYRRSLATLQRLLSAEEVDTADLSEVPAVPSMPKNPEEALPESTTTK